IVHRDLKPANVLMQVGIRPGDSSSTSAIFDLQSAIPKVCDFGLAKLLEDGTSVTASDAVLGTASYMPPEQARAEADQIGPEADVYALGAILYEVLTGRPPFQGATAAETVLLVLTEDPVPPRRFQPQVPRDLETICLKCLEKKPGRRYASAQSLAADLARFLA